MPEPTADTTLTELLDDGGMLPEDEDYLAPPARIGRLTVVLLVALIFLVGFVVGVLAGRLAG